MMDQFSMIYDPGPSNTETFRDEETENLKQFVFRYLSRNFERETIDNFVREARLGPDVPTTEEGEEDDYKGAELLGRYHKSNSKKVIEEYNHVHKWVESSLPLYRTELEEILFPLFVFSYLDIVMSEHHKEYGEQFFSAYESYHERKFPEAVLQLKCVTSPALMEYSQYVRMLVDRHRPFLYHIRLSSGSLELFSHYILDQGFENMRKIAEERIEFETYKGQPRQRSNNTSVLFQSKLTNIPKTNSLRIDWDNPKFNAVPVNRAPSDGMFGERYERSSSSAQNRRKNRAKSGFLPSFCLYTMLGCTKNPPNAAIIKLMGNNEGKEMNDVEGYQKTITIAVACSEMPIRCWNWDGFRGGSSDERQKSKYIGGKRRSKATSLRGHHKSVLSLDLNHDCQWMLSSSLDRNIILWNVKTKNAMTKYQQPHPSWQVRFSSIGYVFGSVGLDRAVTIWVTDRPDPVRLLVGHTSDVLCLSFHQKTDFVASGSEDQTVRCWDTRTPKQIRLLSGPRESVQCLSFSRDGNYLACGAGANIWIWDLRSSKFFEKFTLHLDEVIKLGFTPRDDVLVSSSMDGTVKMWDVKVASSGHPSNIKGGAGSSSSSSSNSSNVKEMMKKKVLLNTFYTKNTPVYDFEYVSENTIVGLGVLRKDINMFNI